MNSKQLPTIPEMKQRRSLWLKVLIIGILGFLFAPFAVLAITGLAGLITAGLIGFTAIVFGPWVADKLAILSLKARMKQAMENPIEQLIIIGRRKENELKEYQEAVIQLVTERNTLIQKNSELIKQYPEERGRFDKEISMMIRLCELREAKLKEAADAVEKYKQGIKKASVIWDVAKAAMAAKIAAGQLVDPMDELLTQTSLDSVQRSMHTAFAELEIEMAKETPQVPMLTNESPGEYVPVLPARENVSVRK